MKYKKISMVLAALLTIAMLLSACGDSSSDVPTNETDQAAADKVAAMIDAIYVQQRTEDTDAQCKAAKEGWDALTDAQKELERAGFEKISSEFQYDDNVAEGDVIGTTPAANSKATKETEAHVIIQHILFIYSDDHVFVLIIYGNYCS